jgi:ribulose-5-phosphate 4-epimerase/fuculose-1-phosphate aldolase
VIHSAIHMGRPDLSCLIHTHTIPGMAISTLQCGLLPLTQSALRFGSVAYHEFEGVAIEMGERERLVRDMGQSNVMILKNHGLIAGGRTIAEAFNNIYRMERAAAVQLQAMACNAPLEEIQPGIIESTIGQFKSERAAHQPSSSPDSSPESGGMESDVANAGPQRSELSRIVSRNQ